MKRILITISVLAILLIPTEIIADQTIAFTSRSVDFWGYMPGLQVGDIVTAYDPDGVLCGSVTVNHEGAYGFLHVYADDEMTERDEGARTGDLILFEVNGIEVTPDGHNVPVWKNDGDQVRVNFR